MTDTNSYLARPCVVCEMPDEVCLDRMNSEPGQPRCCHACGLADTHNPDARVEHEDA